MPWNGFCSNCLNIRRCLVSTPLPRTQRLVNLLTRISSKTSHSRNNIADEEFFVRHTLLTMCDLALSMRLRHHMARLRSVFQHDCSEGGGEANERIATLSKRRKPS